MRFRHLVSVIYRPSSKRKRRLPHNIVQRTDSEVIERIFVKQVKRKLDSIASSKGGSKKDGPDHAPSC